MWAAFGLGLKGGLAAVLSFVLVQSFFKGLSNFSRGRISVVQGPETACFAYGGTSGECLSLVYCARYFCDLYYLEHSKCRLTTEAHGICCPISDIVYKEPHHEPNYPRSNVSLILPRITTFDMDLAYENGLEELRRRQEKERYLVKGNVVASRGSSAFFHARLFETRERIYLLGSNATLVLFISTDIALRFTLNREQTITAMPYFNLTTTIRRATCPISPLCLNPKQKYRSIDGTCNNLLHSTWGSAGATLTRLLLPDYSDGLNVPRIAVSGRLLPSPRLISSVVHPYQSVPYQNFTLVLMQWGQFIDHDITHTPISKGPALTDISCCDGGIYRAIEDLHPECLPIYITPNDTFYGSYKQGCMEFVRSMPAIRPNCSLGPREQMNQISSYIDASAVYGSTDSEAINLRSLVNGRLKSYNKNGLNLLPIVSHCSANKLETESCLTFKAGDSRVNEQPQLVVMHTVWLRQHNFLVQKLAKLNPGWSDEILYQEGRRIVIAQIQHITYNEFLPILLGRQFVEIYGLIPLRGRFFEGYREDVDATIINAFASAAFRFGHSLLVNELRTITSQGRIGTSYNLSSLFFNVSFLHQQSVFDSFVRGLIKQAPERTDRYFTPQVTSKLFSGHHPFGLDLVSLNIQRGRDHGIPPYVRWRTFCGLKSAYSFNDLLVDMDQQTVDALQSVYENVYDIDLFVGGISEIPINGTILGPTFLCIIAKQFIRLKTGDRFFYENDWIEKYHGALTSFTPSQLKEIRKTSLARILCDNTNIKLIQPLAFVQPAYVNTKVSCTDHTKIPIIKLHPWKV